MTKHTDGAVKAAERIAHIDWIQTGKTEYDKLKLETIITIIDQETGLPEITEERDRLRETLEPESGEDDSQVDRH